MDRVDGGSFEDVLELEVVEGDVAVLQGLLQVRTAVATMAVVGICGCL